MPSVDCAKLKMNFAGPTSYFYGNGQSITSNSGSSYVFRHNTVVGTELTKNYRMTNASGLSTYWPRGSRSYEVYNNSFSTNISSGLYRIAVGVGGGDGVIFNNTATATISRTVELNVSGFTCGSYPGADQILSLYIWNNSDNSAQIGYTTNGIDNTCLSSIVLGRDYFLTPRPGYVPYMYPHPLRAN